MQGIDRGRVLAWLGWGLAVALVFVAVVRPGLDDATPPWVPGAGAALAATAPQSAVPSAGAAAALRQDERPGRLPAALADDPDLARPSGEVADRIPWKGPVAHIFFHSLIVYPELAFKRDRQAGQFKEYMITRDQFVRILDQLYANDFVLIDIRLLYATDEHGQVSRRELLLPAGKKPLVISLDDLSYYDYMRGRGFAEKLVLDGEGRVATQVVTPAGERVVTRTGDVVPILDDFVVRHPDFSLDGAKGVIALTGFQGVLGYRTQFERPKDKEPQKRRAAAPVRAIDPMLAAVIAAERAAMQSVRRAAERQAARPIIARLQATGWVFASHSYSHNHKFRTDKVTEEYVANDAVRWRQEVGALVGPTDIFIGPFGQVFKPGEKRRDLLVAAGFRMLCGVGMKPMLAVRDGYVQMDRADIDGYRLDHSAGLLKPYFNVASVGGRGVADAKTVAAGRTAKAGKTTRIASASKDARRSAGKQAARPGATKQARNDGKSKVASAARIDVPDKQARRAALSIGSYRKQAGQASGRATR
jgi:hypothetical protein